MVMGMIIPGIIFLVISIPLWFFARTISLISGLVGLILLTIGIMGKRREIDLVSLEDTEAVFLP